MIPRVVEAPSQSTEHYSLEPTRDREERKGEVGRTGNVRETWMSEDDYELPEGDDYENADEINTIAVGRR